MNQGPKTEEEITAAIKSAEDFFDLCNVIDDYEGELKFSNGKVINNHQMLVYMQHIWQGRSDLDLKDDDDFDALKDMMAGKGITGRYGIRDKMLEFIKESKKEKPEQEGSSPRQKSKF